MGPAPLAMALLACNTDYALHTSFPRQGDALCLAAPQSQLFPLTGSERYAGWSVDMASSSDRIGPLNLYRWVVVGAPGDPNDEETGFVQISRVDLNTGLIDPSEPSNRTFRAPTGAPVYHYGWSVHAADVRDCRRSSLGNYEGCGQEIWVGAPDVWGQSTRGRVFWYEPDGDATDANTGVTPYLWAGTLNPPSRYAAGAEFGYAIASRRLPTNPQSPWDIAGATPPWVAISAPGAGVVLIYAVNPASNTPLTLAQELIAPDARRHFGQALAVGDFDADGLADLAVGAPLSGAVLEGRVYVYRGQSGAAPLLTTPLELDGQALTGSASGGVEADSFGWALAAGPVAAGHNGDALMVGAPRSGADDDGGVCQFLMQASGTGLGLVDGRCWGNSFLSAVNIPRTFENQGWALSIGNYHNNDDHFLDDTREARAPDVAVARPGYRGANGAVDLFLTDTYGYVWDEYATTIEMAPSPIAGARFGAALAGGYAQQSHWMDLVIGAPYRRNGNAIDGLAQLSKAVESSACTEITGTWEATDSEGDPVAIQVFQVDGTSPAVHVVLLEPYNMGAIDDFGGPNERVCTTTAGGNGSQDATFFLPTGTDLALPGLWTCGSTNQQWRNVDASPILAALGLSVGSGWTMDVALTYDAAAGTILLDLSSAQINAAMALAQLDSPSCALEPLPIDMNLLTPGVCE